MTSVHLRELARKMDTIHDWASEKEVKHALLRAAEEIDHLKKNRANVIKSYQLALDEFSSASRKELQMLSAIRKWMVGLWVPYDKSPYEMGSKDHERLMKASVHGMQMEPCYLLDEKAADDLLKQVMSQ